MSEIKLDRIEKEQGRRVDGFIEYGKRPDYTDFLLPIITIKGTKPGPTLLVDACTHGDEYEGAEAIIKLAKELENTDFSGTFIGVPALNIEAFASIERASTTDGMNLNRIFPGNLDTYITQRLAATYMDRVVRHADFVITFHGGGDVLHLEPICGYLPPEDDVSKKAYEMAKAFNIRYTWRLQNLPFSGVSALEYKKAFNIPTILPEIGSHCGRLYDREKNIGLCYRGIKNVMAYLEMLEDWKEEPIEIMDTELHYLHCWNGGIQTLCKKENEIVEEGETLAVMHDLFGNQIEELKAPYRGVVIGFWSVPVIRPGDWWLLYAKIL